MRPIAKEAAPYISKEALPYPVSPYAMKKGDPQKYFMSGTPAGYTLHEHYVIRVSSITWPWLLSKIRQAIKKWLPEQPDTRFSSYILFPNKFLNYTTINVLLTSTFRPPSAAFFKNWMVSGHCRISCWKSGFIGYLGTGYYGMSNLTNLWRIKFCTNVCNCYFKKPVYYRNYLIVTLRTRSLNVHWTCLKQIGSIRVMAPSIYKMA